MIDTVNSWICEIALLTSGFIYIRTIEKREKFRRAALLDAAIFLILAGILIYIVKTEISFGNLFMRMLEFLVIVHFMCVARKLSVKAGIYYAIWAFMSWQILYEIWFMIEVSREYFFKENFIVSVWIECMVFLAGYLIAAFTIAKWMPEKGRKKIGPRQLSAACLTFCVFECIAFAQQNRTLTENVERWSILHVSQVLLAVVLYLQNELFKKSEMRQELDMLNFLWKKEQEQYLLSKENIALINQKCHDLKHQIRAIRKLKQEDIEQYLKEMEESIQIYEAIVKTGNEVLDTILTEKSLYCRQHGVTISCVADGTLLDFIQTIDLYAILGNAVDNAVEAVEKFKEKEKRQIDILIYKEKKFLVINVVNPIKENLVYEEEGTFPITTKKDKHYHGFGLRSIEHMAKKYGGCVNIHEEDGCFSLTILIPLPG